MERDIVLEIERTRPAMLEYLRELVLVASPTRDKHGVDRVGRRLASTLEGLGMEIRLHPQERFGDLLVAATPAARAPGGILLVGHMDTVLAEDRAPWWREDDTRVYGPGTADMKGGITAAVFALGALAAAGALADLPVRLLLTSDEEVGSPASAPLIADLARASRLALVFEAAGHREGVVTGRKGRLGLELRVRGRAGHAAYVQEGKASAVLELAHQVIGLEALNGRYPGVTVNVGRVAGGLVANTVPETAAAEVDVRFLEAGQEETLRREIASLVARPTVPGTSAEADVLRCRPPMESTAEGLALFRSVAEAAAGLGLTLTGEHRAGVSDANLVAREGVPVLDGMGPAGDHLHSEREYAVKESLFERAALAALAISQLARS